MPFNTVKLDTITQQAFEELLNWLDSDRDQAAVKYEDIRDSLVKIFSWRGLDDAEGLADEVINRVAIKVPQLASTFTGDPALYFYGVAKRLIQETLKATHRGLSLDDPSIDVEAIPAKQRNDIEEVAEQLEACLQQLAKPHRELLLKYYTYDRRDKIAHHKQLAQEFGITNMALRQKVYRLRRAVQKCLEERFDRQ